MIVIVGHGPSAWDAVVDDHTVIRLATAGWDKPGRRVPKPGKRTDIVVSSLPKYRWPGCREYLASSDEYEFWLIDNELRRFCDLVLSPFNPKNPKASTGLCAAILARDRYPDDEIRVTGFDWTLHPETAVDYRHDAFAENACLMTLNIRGFNG